MTKLRNSIRKNCTDDDDDGCNNEFTQSLYVKIVKMMMTTMTITLVIT